MISNHAGGDIPPPTDERRIKLATLLWGALFTLSITASALALTYTHAVFATPQLRYPALCAVMLLVNIPVAILAWLRFPARSNAFPGSLDGLFIHTITYLILSLALLRGLFSSSDFSGLVDSLLLFVLVELATCIYDTILTVRSQLSDDTDKLRDAKSHFQILDNLGWINSEARKEIDLVVRHWRDLAEHAELLDAEHTYGHSVHRHCIDALTSIYFSETRRGRIGKVDRPDETDETDELDSLRLDRVLKTTDYREVVRITTHVGMYARLLTRIVNEVQAHTQDDRRPCLAVITDVLPAHMWNWPIGLTRWYHHPSIATYRKALKESTASYRMLTDRVILVHQDREWTARSPTSSDHNNAGESHANSSYPAGPQGGNWRLDNKDVFCRTGPLWPECLIVEMKKWRIFIRDSDDGPTQYKKGEGGYKALELLPFLGCFREEGVEDDIKVAEFFPMVRRHNGELPSYRSESLFTEYHQQLHGGENADGRTCYLPINESEFRSENGFAGFHDVMFVGSAPKASRKKANKPNLWLDEKNEVGRQWIIGFVASMSPATKTMHLGILQGKALDYFWRHMSGSVNRRSDLLRQLDGEPLP